MTFLKYSVLRIAFILVCAFGLKLAGAQGALLWVLAILLGMLLSYLLLGRERDELTSRLASRKERKDSALERLAAEDADFEDNL
ncbi:DUF4229 domain-containing protein [Populibacterium corticicola]|uniref:DUF4229 domain-containing protein n=1 Tax=Populibacterium corticicola TaxID=1812826 RepID=A0ABW5XGR0_9MICO